MSSVLQADSLPAEPPGKLQGTHVLHTKTLAQDEALSEEWPCLGTSLVVQ